MEFGPKTFLVLLIMFSFSFSVTSFGNGEIGFAFSNNLRRVF